MWNLNQNTPGVKKEQPRVKKALLKKVWSQNGWPRPPAFDRIKNLIIMTSLQNIVISGVQGLAPDVNGIKIFDKDY